MKQKYRFFLYGILTTLAVGFMGGWSWLTMDDDLFDLTNLDPMNGRIELLRTNINYGNVSYGEGTNNIIIGMYSRAAGHSNCIIVGIGLACDEDYQIKIGGAEFDKSRVMTDEEFQQIWDVVQLLRVVHADNNCPEGMVCMDDDDFEQLLDDARNGLLELDMSIEPEQ